MACDLSMYGAPDCVQMAQQTWLAQTMAILGERLVPAGPMDRPSRWLLPELMLSQTCGYPLVTSLRGKVRVVGRPSYEFPHSTGGYHCSLLLCRDDSAASYLAEFVGSHGLINAQDSNSGMNMFRHTLSKLRQDGFFSQISFTGSHRESMRRLKNHAGDLAAIDSVTYDYLAKYQSEEVDGLKIFARSDQSPCLPYITSIARSRAQAEKIRWALNKALHKHPQLAQDLAIKEVLPANEATYAVLHRYEKFALERHFKFIASV